MNSTIIKGLFVFAFCSVFLNTVQAATLDALRSRLNFYLGDTTNTMLPSYIKDSILNVSQHQYAESYPVYIDTTSQTLTASTRMYALPSDYAGRVISVHKNDANFTRLKYTSTDTTIPVVEGAIEYYSVQEAILIIYPNPTTTDSVFVFYAAYPAYLGAGATESGLRDGLEGPLVLLAASKCWAMKEYRIDLADWFYNRYEREAARLMRLEVEQVQR